MTTVCATMATGVACHLCTAWTFTDGDLPRDRWEVVGDHGSVELVVGESLQLYCEGRRTNLPLVEADNSLRNEQDHFLACVRDRSRKPALDLLQAFAGLKLADAAKKFCARAARCFYPSEERCLCGFKSKLFGQMTDGRKKAPHFRSR